MNKAVVELKQTLGEMFENVYEAFAFFDIDGDWGISEDEFKKMLDKLDIHLEENKLNLVVRRMDVVADGMIDPKEFIQALRWHPSMYKKFSDEEAAMRRASQKRGKIVKDAMLKVAENRVAMLKLATLKRQTSLFQAVEVGSPTRTTRSPTARSPPKTSVELVGPLNCFCICRDAPQIIV